MTHILSIETATPVCSVAIHNDDKLLVEVNLQKEKSHSGKLAQLIKQSISNCDLQMSDISAVAVSEGPGSYTGLRIGVSTAKGLCYALKVPLISVNSLTALAAGVQEFIEEDALMVPMFDARRMEVYSQVLDKRLNIEEETTPVIIDEASFSKYLNKKKLYFFGDGAEKCSPVIQHENASFIKGVAPKAGSVGKVGYSKFLNKDFVDVAYFEPFYLKEYRAGKPKSLI